MIYIYIGPPVVPFYSFWGRVPYQNRLQTKGYPYSNLSTGGPVHIYTYIKVPHLWIPSFLEFLVRTNCLEGLKAKTVCVQTFANLGPGPAMVCYVDRQLQLDCREGRGSCPLCGGVPSAVFMTSWTRPIDFASGLLRGAYGMRQTQLLEELDTCPRRSQSKQWLF